jgi:hypothetical protein
MATCLTSFVLCDYSAVYPKYPGTWRYLQGQTLYPSQAGGWQSPGARDSSLLCMESVESCPTTNSPGERSCAQGLWIFYQKRYEHMADTTSRQTKSHDCVRQEWTTQHSYFVNMGGFVVDITERCGYEEQGGLAFTPGALVHLTEEKLQLSCWFNDDYPRRQDWCRRNWSPRYARLTISELVLFDQAYQALKKHLDPARFVQVNIPTLQDYLRGDITQESEIEEDHNWPAVATMLTTALYGLTRTIMACTLFNERRTAILAS